MKNLILGVFTLINLFSITSLGQGLKTVVYKQNEVIQMKYVLTCGPMNSTCQLTCGNANQCEIPQAQSCFDCYRDSDLTIRALFNQPQKRYATERAFNAEAQASIFRDPQIFVVGIRQNILLDPLKAETFTQLQSGWNSMCPATISGGDSVFLIKQTESGYKPFALMCGENLLHLQYESSYGRGAPVELK